MINTQAQLSGLRKNGVLHWIYFTEVKTVRTDNPKENSV